MPNGTSLLEIETMTLFGLYLTGHQSRFRF
jgi:hypothetical protein